MNESVVLFDRILASVGDDGKFQRRFNAIFVILMGLATTMAFMNLILIMAVPDHWCHVPGREKSNVSLGSWKDMYLPKELDARGKLSYSSCSMYNITVIQSGKKPSNGDIVACQFGYDYDETWYTRTVPTDQNWVCEKGLYVSNILATSRFVKVVGMFILGQLGDCIGRRRTLIVSFILVLVSKAVSMFTSHLYYVFMISSALSIFPNITAVQSSLVIAMEISNERKRAWLAQLVNVSSSAAMIILALICWAIPDWFIFYAITNAPLIFLICAYGLMIESPRWLASRGKMKECIRVVEKIAKVNGTKPDPELMVQLRDHPNRPEKSLGIISTISSWRLAKNTFIITANIIISILVQFLIVLNFANLEGNPFLNFLWQSAIEIPSCIVGKWSCDKFGRRFSSSISFFLTTVMCIPIIIAIRGDDMSSVINILVIALKFFMAIASYVTMLQTMEIFPTCVRQSGMSLGLSLSGAFSIIGPYVIYVGTSIDARYPYVMIAVMGAASAFLNAFLPETLHAKLPETLQEARDFGKEQHFFSMPKKRRETAPPEKMKFINTDKPM